MIVSILPATGWFAQRGPENTDGRVALACWMVTDTREAHACVWDGWSLKPIGALYALIYDPAKDETGGLE